VKGASVKSRTEKTSAYRKLSMLGFELVRGSHNFYALLEFDVSELRSTLRHERKRGRSGSFFACILKALGMCLEEYPELNSMINGRKKTTFYEVDINIPIEIHEQGNIYNTQCIIRDINKKSIAEIDAEMSRAKTEPGEEQAYMSSKLGRHILTVLPKRVVLLFFRFILKNHELVKKLSGTVFATSVSMFSDAPGHVIPYVGGPKAVSFAVGSVVKKPVVRKNEITIREMVHLTAVFNHDIVDGAPAARFINQLRRYIEKDYREIIF
jgi:pyruvate/2-oxoglutarate dehydrogenase complex dihydrolipoamide acyltransferase (E2) component